MQLSLEQGANPGVQGWQGDAPTRTAAAAVQRATDRAGGVRWGVLVPLSDGQACGQQLTHETQRHLQTCHPHGSSTQACVGCTRCSASEAKAPGQSKGHMPKAGC